MSVNKEASGRRSVQVEIDVPGTPEQVWQAIATGPGISSWFVPTEVESRDGTPVAMTATFGPGMAPRSTVTAWNPPQAFATQLEGWGGSPPIAAEWSIEALSGDVCRVRVVNSLFADSDDWDDQLEAGAGAWPGFFRILRIYLAHFSGQPCEMLQFVLPVAGTEAEAWTTLTSAMGVAGAGVKDRWTSPGGTPSLAGVVEYITHDPYDALILLDLPTPGIAALGVFAMGSQSMVAVNFYHYGDQAKQTVASQTPKWQAWMQERFS